jgi:hypothetical protein
MFSETFFRGGFMKNVPTDALLNSCLQRDSEQRSTISQVLGQLQNCGECVDF